MFVKAVSFILLSLAIAFVSRGALRSPRSHGFVRFFAWEVMLAQFLLVVQDWFKDPFAWHQLVSWDLLLDSLVLLGFGVHALFKRGRASRAERLDPSLFGFEKTTALVTTGIYRFIRHPLYGALLLLSWGIFFKVPGLAGGALASLATVLLTLTAMADERECVAYFGDEYRQYMRRSKRFVPFLF